MKAITEQIVGRWFAQGGGRREKVVLATKVYGIMGDWPNESKLSALHIRRACEDSLRRLQTDYIDLYQMHHIDRATPWEEIWQAMEMLVQQGKVLYVGSSNFAGWHIAKANESRQAPPFFMGWSASSRSTTSTRAHRNWKSSPLARITAWADPLESAGGWVARRRAAKDQ